jgi:hypothetical protein
MLSVFMLFLLPVGGGIPAGVLLARANGLSWPVTAGLYFVSDVVLAVAFEPVLRLLAALGRKVRFLARCGAIMSKAMARNSAYFVRTGAGPITLIMISFGVDPITGRATALAGSRYRGWLGLRDRGRHAVLRRSCPHNLRVELIHQRSEHNDSNRTRHDGTRPHARALFSIQANARYSISTGRPFAAANLL